MARSFSNVKLFSVFLVDGFSNTLTRRGYAVTAQTTTIRGGIGSSMSSKIKNTKSGEDKKVAKSDKVSWVPDPVTGYYKPENINEIDVAELRATLLGKKFNH